MLRNTKRQYKEAIEKLQQDKKDLNKEIDRQDERIKMLQNRIGDLQEELELEKQKVRNLVSNKREEKKSARQKWLNGYYGEEYNA